jgi:hypothetical protein
LEIVFNEKIIKSSYLRKLIGGVSSPLPPSEERGMRG